MRTDMIISEPCLHGAKRGQMVRFFTRYNPFLARMFTKRVTPYCSHVVAGMRTYYSNILWLTQMTSDYDCAGRFNGYDTVFT
jgi:hypothetical protein